MRIDNSSAIKFAFCPEAYRQSYELGRQGKWGHEARTYGTIIHEMLKAHFLAKKGISYAPQVPSGYPDLELEAKLMMAGYEARYPQEDFEVVDIERTFEVQLNDKHSLVGKWDGIVRSKDSGRLRILEHKSEARGAKSNLPTAWAARSQVGLYLWAAEQLYEEPVEDIILDVLTRQSPAGRKPAEFRRDPLQRSPVQVQQALRNIIYAADQIEALQQSPFKIWPSHTENCCKWNFKCDYYKICVDCQGEPTKELLEHDYEAMVPYLEL